MRERGARRSALYALNNSSLALGVEKRVVGTPGGERSGFEFRPGFESGTSEF